MPDAIPVAHRRAIVRWTQRAAIGPTGAASAKPTIRPLTKMLMGSISAAQSQEQAGARMVLCGSNELRPSAGRRGTSATVLLWTVSHDQVTLRRGFVLSRDM